MGGFELFLANHFSFDAFAQVEAAKAGHCNPFVWILPMEESRSLFHGPARPKPQGLGVGQKVYVLLFKLA